MKYSELPGIQNYPDLPYEFKIVKCNIYVIVSRSQTRFSCESLAPGDYIYVYEYLVHAAFIF